MSYDNDSVFTSKLGYKTALLNPRTLGGDWRIVLINSITETQEELFFDEYDDAKQFIENWLED
jgi:hypothetical protein